MLENIYSENDYSLKNIRMTMGFNNLLENGGNK